MTTLFAVKMQTSAFTAILLAIISTTVNVDAYSKYNRGCNDINCLSDQVCVIARDECTANKPECGTYPTCISNGAKETCRTKMCEQGTYCKTEDGVPKCIKTNSGLAPAAQKLPGWKRPQINTPRSTPPTPPPRQRPSATLRPTYPARPTPPTPPPRGSSFDDRYRGHSGDRNTIGGNSIWDRLFGGGGSKPKPSSPSGGGGSSGFFDRPTSKPSGSNYYPGGKDKYNTHVSTDSNGNRQWTFSG